MAIKTGPDAATFAQFVRGPLAAGEFEVNLNSRVPTVPRGRKDFNQLSNADVVMYRAVSLDDPSKWEVGKATYDSTAKQMDRTDANVIASSNSNNRVNFKRADGTPGTVLVGLITSNGRAEGRRSSTSNPASNQPRASQTGCPVPL